MWTFSSSDVITRIGTYLTRCNLCSFFDAIDRVSKDDFVPTDQDMLQARIVTTGIFETRFIVDEVVFQYVHCGSVRIC